MYSELVYFSGAHFAHIVAYHEDRRLRRLLAAADANRCRTMRPTRLYTLPSQANIAAISAPVS
jgi:hypothetical protein